MEYGFYLWTWILIAPTVVIILDWLFSGSKHTDSRHHSTDVRESFPNKTTL